MKTLLILVTFFSMNAFGDDQCINIDEARAIANQYTYDDLSKVEIDDLIGSLKLDDKNKIYFSEIFFNVWPGGHEGANIQITCDGKFSYWSGCSGDCD